MTSQQLFDQIRLKKSYLCVGLDTDISKIPSHLLKDPDPVFAFNKAIIDATQAYAVAYKPNLAFYESLGASGWASLEKTIQYIPENCFTIADAKRGDIGNTASLYAKAFFEKLNVDAITVAPYMGADSIQPFLEFKGKWAIVLALTSNKGADDFQLSNLLSSTGDERNEMLFEKVLRLSSTWGNPDNMMYVVGATRAEMIRKVRACVPDHFLLVPGIGAQGGDLEAISKNGFNKKCGLLVNSSRQIIYAGFGPDFALKAGEEAKRLQQEMNILLMNGGLY